MNPSLSLNSRLSYLCLLSAGVTSAHQHPPLQNWLKTHGQERQSKECQPPLSLGPWISFSEALSVLWPSSDEPSPLFSRLHFLLSPHHICWKCSPCKMLHLPHCLSTPWVASVPPLPSKPSLLPGTNNLTVFKLANLEVVCQVNFLLYLFCFLSLSPYPSLPLSHSLPTPSLSHTQSHRFMLFKSSAM